MLDILQVHAELMEIHEEIRQEYDQLDESTLKDYLGDFYCELHHQARKHGDGYTLRSVPTDIDDMLSADDIVLIVMKYPLLNSDSVFNPHTDLTTIHYWQEGFALSREARLDDGSSLRFHFMVWEHDYPTHGETDSRARTNWQSVSPEIGDLLDQQESVSERFILTLTDWLRTQGRQMVVLTNAQKKQFDRPIAQLIRSRDVVWHRPTKLTRPNRTITDILTARRNSPH